MFIGSVNTNLGQDLQTHLDCNNVLSTLYDHAMQSILYRLAMCAQGFKGSREGKKNLEIKRK